MNRRATEAGKWGSWSRIIGLTKDAEVPGINERLFGAGIGSLLAEFFVVITLTGSQMRRLRCTAERDFLTSG